MWRYGGGDWLEPWRIYHGLGEDFRPIDDQEAEPRRPQLVKRYRHMIYGFAKAAAIMEEGAKDRAPKRSKRPRDRDGVAAPPEQRRASGLVLPTGMREPPR